MFFSDTFALSFSQFKNKLNKFSWICTFGLCIGTSPLLAHCGLRERYPSAVKHQPDPFSLLLQLLTAQQAAPTESSGTNIWMQCHKLITEPMWMRKNKKKQDHLKKYNQYPSLFIFRRVYLSHISYKTQLITQTDGNDQRWEEIP